MKAKPMSIARLPQRYIDSQFYTTKIPFYAQFLLVGGDGNVALGSIFRSTEEVYCIAPHNPPTWRTLLPNHSLIFRPFLPYFNFSLYTLQCPNT